MDSDDDDSHSDGDYESQSPSKSDLEPVSDQDVEYHNHHPHEPEAVVRVFEAVAAFEHRALALQHKIDQLVTSSKIYAPDWDRRYVLFSNYNHNHTSNSSPSSHPHYHHHSEHGAQRRTRADMVLQRLRRSLVAEMRFLNTLKQTLGIDPNTPIDVAAVTTKLLNNSSNTRNTAVVPSANHARSSRRTDSNIINNTNNNNNNNNAKDVLASASSTYARIKSSNITHLIAVVRTVCHPKVQEVCDVGCSFPYTGSDGMDTQEWQQCCNASVRASH